MTMSCDPPPGALVYTQMLNTRGGIECDLTVGRLAEDRFYIVTGTGFRTHDFAWIRQNIPEGGDAALVADGGMKAHRELPVGGVKAHPATGCCPHRRSRLRFHPSGRH